MKAKGIKVQLVVASLAILCALTIGVSPAHANSIAIDYVSTVFDGGAGNFVYTYAFKTTTDTLSTGTPGTPGGTFFTLYDFIGYVAGSANVSGLAPAAVAAGPWVISTANTGVTPQGLAGALTPADNPGIVNVTFTWNGADLNVVSGDHGTFSLRSTINVAPVAAMAWAGNITSTADLNTAEKSTGTLRGPNVPEPTSLVLLGAGLAGLAVAIRRRK